MKINARSFKHIKSYVVFCLLVTLLFPYSVLAGESQYRVPKNSLSYFLQNPAQKKYLETTTESPSGSVIPPLTSIEDIRGDRPVTEDITQPVSQQKEPVAIQEVYVSKPIVEKAKDEFTMSWRNETPDEIHVPIQKADTNKLHVEDKYTNKVVNTATQNKTTPVKIARHRNKTTPIKITRHPKLQHNNKAVTKKTIKKKPTTKRTILASAPDTNSPFTRALAKMRSRKAARDAEAQRLGITLPSQNGDIASVSPSLSKINSTVNQILSRHAATSSRV